MLVSELREVLKKYKEEDLRLIIAQMYKSMPKKLREDKDIDALLQDVSAYMRTGKVERTQERQDINSLKAQIDQFVDHAYKQYYFAPNTFVHKKERPKWRFMVKAYIKELQHIPADDADGTAATELLQKLYAMLSYGCGYYIFSTDDPFRSVGTEQTALLDVVIVRKFSSGISKESVRSAIELVINSNVDRTTLHSSLICTLVANLKTTDFKEMAIEQCVALKAELEKPKPAPSKKAWGTSLSDYALEEKLNQLIEMVFRIHVELCEFEEAIAYFKNNHIERHREISLYILLELLYQYDLKEYWLKEYDEAVKRKIVPREELRRTYMRLQESRKGSE